MNTIALRLRELAEPVFTRKRPISGQCAQLIRLNAILLANAYRDLRVSADDLLSIVAGTILLQRWESGDVPRTETIVLATSCA